MNRNEIITALKAWFDVRELVCPHTYERWKERSWNFLDTDLLAVLLWLRRDTLKVPLTLNDYKNGGSVTQRGLRCNLCPLVKGKTRVYLSQHCMGKALDIVSAKMTAAEMRRLIKVNSASLPCPVRIEKDVTWLHVDVMDSGNGQKVTEFSE